MKGLVDIQDANRPVICIAGPTASGKSDLAVRVAKQVGGEVVNADALQVYADIQILSARPKPSEMEDVPHHLFGSVKGHRLYSTGDWVRDAVPILSEIMGRGRVPILCGGTGLYFTALLEGLADIPDVPGTIRETVEAMEVSDLKAEALRVDPVATARVLGDDSQRLARIVSVYRASGRALSDWQADTLPMLPENQTQRAVLLPDRAKLYDRINLRFDSMIEAGGLDEARAVHAQDYPVRAPMLKAIGLSHLLSHLDGALDLDTALDLAKRDTRRLAKRQMTWFRNRCSDWTVLSSQEDIKYWVAAL